MVSLRCSLSGSVSFGFKPLVDPVWVIKRLGRVHRHVQGTVPCGVKHQSHTAHIGHHVGSAIRKEGKRDACDRHQAKRHGDILQNMEEQHAHNADDDEPSEFISCEPGKVEHPEKDKPESEMPLPLFVSDYIAGMTDTYAIKCFNELFKN